MIKDDVRHGHLLKYPSEEAIVEQLTSDFDITWARRFVRFNTELSAYFLKPKPHITQSFGFEQELLLAVTDYPTLEARTIQAVEGVFQDLPARGRVDQTVAILISAASNVESWMSNYANQNPQARAYVCISTKHLQDNHDNWYIRNILIKQLYSRDLFDYTLPLDNDTFFFGRQNIVAEHIDAIRRSENRGLFGLRKTGKTSLLFKIVRQSADNGINAIYYDCKLPSLYKKGSDDLLDRISNDIAEKLQVTNKAWKKEDSAPDRLYNLVKGLNEDQRFCLIFDEVEYISYLSSQSPHWQHDFIEFWQTLWSVQSQFRRFGFIIAGVNASVVEVDRINGVQNPIFGIVKSSYLTGFDKPEIYSLTTVLGKRMGLHFDDSAVGALFDRYGGHPLLTRMICSQINTSLRVSGAKRPAKVSKSNVLGPDLDGREEEIRFYCNHITSELEEFYPEEFEMLEMLATKNIADFNELASESEFVRHLRSYGLLDLSVAHKPRIRIPVIEGFVAAKWRKRTGAREPRYVVPEERRQAYVSGRLSSILSDYRAAEKRFVSAGLPELYGQGGPREAEKFASLGRVSTRDELVSFLNQANRTLVEPIDELGKRNKSKNYFFDDIQSAYPDAWYGLNRLRSYRNFVMHLDLVPGAKQQLDKYLKDDFDGSSIDMVNDGYFRVQAAVLDGLLIGMQADFAKYD